MDSYTVKQVSSILHTNEETVRRWIRSGKLSATLTSKKGGHVISAEALDQFVKQTPKYAAFLAAAMIAPPIALPLAIGNLVNSLLTLADVKKTVTSNDVETILKRDIASREKTLAKKEAQLQKLQKEISEEQEKIDQYRYALNNLDLTEIADKVNAKRRK